MSAAHQPIPGANLANPPVSDVTMEDDGMAFKDRFAGGSSASDRMGGAFGPPVPSSILECWTPSDRRRLGHLSFKAYDQATMNCPTDLWSYQRLFIEQQRDAANLWAPKLTPR